MSNPATTAPFYQRKTHFQEMLIEALLKILDTLDSMIQFMSRRLRPTYKEDLKYNTWLSETGQYLRYDYTLNQDSLVFDLGGYHGDWTGNIVENYWCNVYVFEPVQEYYEHITKRFSKNKKVRVYQFGLADRTMKVNISVNKDASSVCRSVGPCQGISLVKASDFFEENSITHIDLMKINIEGGEYDLLDHLIENNLIRIIDNIQIQFHNFYPDAEKRMERIQSTLQKSHHLTYQYKFGFENWEKNK
jgi:FkbM family methyltransferase